MNEAIQPKVMAWIHKLLYPDNSRDVPYDFPEPEIAERVELLKRIGELEDENRRLTQRLENHDLLELTLSNELAKASEEREMLAKHRQEFRHLVEQAVQIRMAKLRDETIKQRKPA